MKLLSYLSIASLLASVLGQEISEPECREWTNEVYAANPNLQPAEDAYVESVAGTIHANCLDRDDGSLDGCDIALGASNVGTNYTRECNENDGVMWQYDYSPKCGDSNVKQWIKRVLVCASSKCSATGVQNLIPDPGFLEHLVDAGYTCGTGTMNLKRVPGDSSSGANAMMISSGIAALVAMTGYLIA